MFLCALEIFLSTAISLRTMYSRPSMSFLLMTLHA
jgi:hypothetical protein